jgi:filamentous hemagglutinin
LRRSFQAGRLKFCTSDEEAQDLALLSAGAEYAQAHSLALGVALSPEQMRAPTTDLVWLVGQDVALTGGSVRMNVAGHLSNTGTITGRRVVDLTATNIGNDGRITSGDLARMTAREDIASSGAIDA